MQTEKKSSYMTPLSQAGLTYAQAEVYEVLIKNGPLKASKVHQKTGLKRGLVYKVLDELVNLGIVTKNERVGKIAVFAPEHPAKLQDFTTKKEDRAKTASLALNGVLGKLISDFNLVSGKPGIQFFEGVSGLEKIYNDIIDTGQNFYLVRSAYEPTYNQQILPVVQKFIRKRIKNGIKVMALTPKDEFASQSSPRDDLQMLMQRTWLDKNSYNAPVEIDIYGNKIAILSFGKELVGLIIQSPQIALSFKQLFSLAKLGASSYNPRLPRDPMNNIA